MEHPSPSQVQIGPETQPDLVNSPYAKKMGPPRSPSKGPSAPIWLWCQTPATRRASHYSAESRVTRLVRRTFRNEDEFDAAVLLLRALLRGGLARPRRATRRVDALLSKIRLRQVRAALRQLRGPGLPRIGVTHNYDLGVGIALQAQGHVVSDALAQVVESRHASLGVATLPYLRRLRRRWRL